MGQFDANKRRKLPESLCPMNIDKVSNYILTFGFISFAAGTFLSEDLVFSKETGGVGYSLSQSVEVYGRYILMCALIWRGTYFLKVKGFQKKYLFELTAGLLLGTVFISLVLFVYSTMQQSMGLLETQAKYTIQDIQSADIESSVKTEVSRTIAGSEYVVSGKVSHFINEYGDLTEYSPTPKEIKERKIIENKISEINGYYQKMRFGIYLMVGLILFSAISAWVAARYNNHRQATQKPARLL